MLKNNKKIALDKGKLEDAVSYETNSNLYLPAYAFEGLGASLNESDSVHMVVFSVV
ncbi:hypothetical protein Hanom_Chr09g00860801 [Helianthus anomalus]